MLKKIFGWFIFIVLICSISANIYFGLRLRSTGHELKDCRNSIEQLQLDNSRLEQKVGVLKQYNSEFGVGLKQLQTDNNTAIGTIQDCRKQVERIRSQVKVLEDYYNKCNNCFNNNNNNSNDFK